MSINKTKKNIIHKLKAPTFILISVIAFIFSSNDKKVDYTTYKDLSLKDLTPINFIQLAHGDDGGGDGGGDGAGDSGAGDSGAGDSGAGGGACGAGGVGDCGAGSSGGSTGDSGAGGDAGFTPNQPTPIVNIYFN